MICKFYYSDELTADHEGNLVQLCDACAAQHADSVEWAGNHAGCCELCDAENEDAAEDEYQAYLRRRESWGAYLDQRARDLYPDLHD